MGLNNEGKKLCDELLKLFLKVGVRKPRKGHVATASVKNRYLEPKSEERCILLREERAEADTGRAGGPHLVGKQQLTLCPGLHGGGCLPFPSLSQAAALRSGSWTANQLARYPVV